MGEAICMRESRLRQILFLCFFVLLCAVTASAQEATIVGTVTDPSGASVTGVPVIITNTETGLVRHITTENNGQYAVPDLHIGHYAVRVEAPGFKAAEKNDIVLQVGDRLRIDFTLELGSTQESIKVEANAVAVQTDTGEVSNVINGEEVSQLATNGRSVYSLAILVPGAANNMPGFQAPTAVGANSNVAFNGMRQNHNLWLVDGGEDSDRGGAGGIDIMPSIDSIAEFRALTSNYSAEYGTSSAGTMSIVIKSGSRDLHGEAWEFVRNNDFDANDFFRNRQGLPVGDLKANTFGYNVGGPVTFGKFYNKDRNKTFFFFNEEWRKLIQQGSTLDTLVPSTSQYGGNLGSTVINVPNANQLSADQLARFTALGLTPGQPFPNNTIPSSLLDPNAQALLKAGIFPAPNSGSYFVGSNVLPTNVREEVVRIDHSFSDKFTLFGHWVDDQGTQTYSPPMWSGYNVPTVSNSFQNPSYSAVIHAAYTISPTLINEVAFNYDGNRISIVPDGLITASGISIPRLFTDKNNLNRLPDINLSGSASYGNGSFPWYNKCDDYQIKDDVSWSKGAHQMRMGGSWAIYKKQQDLFGNTQGSYSFNGQYTGNSFADFLLGYANNYSELALQDHGQWNAQSWAAYFQDNWRVNSRLTVNLGLRWDGIPHTYEANHRMSNFYPNQYNPANAAILSASGNTIDPSSPGLGTSPNPALSAFQFYLNGMGITGVNGNPNGMVNGGWNGWGPRIGFAYDLTGGGRTVLRGGFGAMYERIQGNDMYNSGSNPPFSASINNPNVSLSNPATSLLTGETVSAPISVASITALSQSNYKLPVSYQFSAGVEHQFGTATVLSATYVGNQNRHQFAYQDINLPAQSLLPALIQGTVAYNTVLPYQGYHSINMGEDGENSHYNAMQLSVHSRMGKDLQYAAAYTLSRSMDPAESFGGDNTNVYNPYNLRYDWGPSQVDATHIIAANFVYDLPIFRTTGNRLAKTVLGGWELSGIWTFQTGFPLQITLNGSQSSNGLAIGTNRPDFNGTASYPKVSGGLWFDPAGFSLPALGAWGNLGKGVIRGPGRDNWNMSLFKDFMISESRGTKFELRFETFNTLNHTQFNGVSTGASFDSNGKINNNFGQVTSAWDPRELQLAGKFIF